MKVTRTVRLSQEELLSAVREMVRADARRAGKKAEPKAGMSWRKKIKNRSGKLDDVKVTIDRFDEEGYAASFSSRHGKSIISYGFALVEGGVEVSYEERFEPAGGGSLDWTHRLFTWLSSRRDRKRLQANLDAFARYALNHVEG